MKIILRVLVPSLSVFLGGCVGMLSMHEPLYPSSATDVTYTLEASSEQGIEKILLFETVSTIDAAGTVTPGVETLLQEWDFPENPDTIDVSYTKRGGYTTNSLVRYRFWVGSGALYWFWHPTRSQDVTYAIRPYPVDDQPAPVYAQGDVDHVFDVVFIPDTDITNMDTFRNHCRSMIVDAVFDEPSIRPWNQQFNFYINPLRGTATDYNQRDVDGLHQTPANWVNLSFAEVKVLMHQNDLRDYTNGGLFSTEQQNRGTMMHEGGHGMFGLSDEYDSTANFQADIAPNNWTTLAGAQADAPSRHKTAADAREIGTSGWYKICVDACQMKTSGLVRSNYDDPCTDRVFYSIYDNAAN